MLVAGLVVCFFMSVFVLCVLVLVEGVVVCVVCVCVFFFMCARVLLFVVRAPMPSARVPVHPVICCRDHFQTPPVQLLSSTEKRQPEVCTGGVLQRPCSTALPRLPTWEWDGGFEISLPVHGSAPVLELGLYEVRLPVIFCQF